MQKFSGIVTALLSPFKATGELNPAMLGKLVKYHIDAGVQGLWLCGGSAEVSLLSIADRKTIAEIVISEVAGQINVFVHVGHDATDVACDLARHAANIGATAIACFPPSIPKPSLQAIQAHYKAVAAASKSLPFIAYHVPGVTGVRIDQNVVGALLDIENLAGVKHSEYNLFDLRNIIELAPERLSVLEGCDEILLAALAMGAHGGVGLTYNVAPKLFLQVYEQFCSGDLKGAQKAQFTITKMINRTFLRFGSHATMKEAMRLSGYDCGLPRPPILPLSQDQRVAVKQELSCLGII